MYYKAVIIMSPYRSTNKTDPYYAHIYGEKKRGGPYQFHQ